MKIQESINYVKHLGPVGWGKSGSITPSKGQIFTAPCISVRKNEARCLVKPVKAFKET